MTLGTIQKLVKSLNKALGPKSIDADFKNFGIQLKNQGLIYFLIYFTSFHFFCHECWIQTCDFEDSKNLRCPQPYFHSSPGFTPILSNVLQHSHDGYQGNSANFKHCKILKGGLMKRSRH